MIDVIDVSSWVDFGGSLINGGPPSVDDKFVQDPLLPGNGNDGSEAGRTLLHTNGTGPLFEKKKIERLKICEVALARTYLIKGSGDDGLIGVVWPAKRKK